MLVETRRLLFGRGLCSSITAQAFCALHSRGFCPGGGRRSLRGRGCARDSAGGRSGAREGPRGRGQGRRGPCVRSPACYVTLCHATS